MECQFLKKCNDKRNQIFIIYTNYHFYFFFFQENTIFPKPIKNSYRSLNTIDQKIDIFADKLPILDDDTKDIIEYVEQSNKKKKKKFNFWNLLEANE